MFRLPLRAPSVQSHQVPEPSPRGACARIRVTRPARALLMLPLLLAPAACGGSKSDSTPPSVPMHWEQPVDLGGSTYLNGSSLSGDGHGNLVAAWLRAGTGSTVEVVAARLHADGTWETTQALESLSPPLAPQAPVVAVDSRGRGWIAWLDTSSAGTQVAFRMVAVDLGASSPFAAAATAFSADLRHPSDLRLAVGSDGSAVVGWTFDTVVTGFDVSTVQVARRGTDGQWSAPVSYRPNEGYRQLLLSLVGHGQGAFLLEDLLGDDASMDGEAYAFAPGSSNGVAVPGWEPAAQFLLPVHETAWAADGLGGLEAWLLYDADTKVYPRQGTAASVWTVADPVALPMDATTIAVTRQPNGSGWLAGSGAAGLWVAPLTGLVPGTAKLLLGPTVTADRLLATQDASGRPTLLWVQSASANDATSRQACGEFHY